MTLENYAVREIDRFPDDGLTGRTKITTTVREITAENVRDVLGETLAVHAKNAAEIQYLWDVYRGKQDIRKKTKYVRENINNKIVMNYANEIVTFKTAYLLSEKIQYISEADDKTENVVRLNKFMKAEDKESKDKEIIDWMHICGVGERFTLTDELAGKKGGAPFYVYTVDPKEGYVIYSARIDRKPLGGVIIQKDENNDMYAQVWTDTKCFTVKRDSVEEEDHLLGEVPLVEYVNNSARMGAFEAVISVLNGINQLESDALDSVNDFVNAFDVFQNCEIAGNDYKTLSVGGQAVTVKSSTPGMEAKVYRIASELSQSGVQQRVDDLKEGYLSICGMPNRNGGTSTSDTGTAVIFRDGWSEAESRAKDTEKLFTRAERQFLRIILNICKGKSGADLGLELEDIGINFGRKSLNNLQSRFQCLCEGLASDKIDPMDVYNAFGDIFGDKTAAYQRGMKWYEELEQQYAEELEAERRSIMADSGGLAEPELTGEEADEAI